MGKGLNFVIIYAIFLLILFSIFCYLITTVNPTKIFHDHGNASLHSLSSSFSNDTYYIKVTFPNDEEVARNEPINTSTVESTIKYSEITKPTQMMQTLIRSQRHEDERLGYKGSEFVIFKIVDENGKSKLEVQITPHCYRRKYTRILDVLLVNNDTKSIKDELLSKSTIVKLLPNDSIHIYEDEGILKSSDSKEDSIKSTSKDEFAIKPPFDLRETVLPSFKSRLQSNKPKTRVALSDTYLPAFMHKNISNSSQTNLSILKSMITKNLNEKLYNKAKSEETRTYRKKYMKEGIYDYNDKPLANDTVFVKRNIFGNKSNLLDPNSLINNARFDKTNNLINMKNDSLPSGRESLGVFFINKTIPKSFKNVTDNTRIIRRKSSSNITTIQPTTNVKNNTIYVKFLNLNNGVIKEVNNQSEALSVFDTGAHENTIFDEQ